jgi:glycerol-3-phosphate dehydrogenase
MPICGFVYDVLHRGVPLKDVVASMLAREVTPEN